MKPNDFTFLKTVLTYCNCHGQKQFVTVKLGIHSILILYFGFLVAKLPGIYFLWSIEVFCDHILFLTEYLFAVIRV